MIFEPQFAQVMRRCSRPLREPHLHSQFPIANLTKSSEQVSRKSLKGKTLVKTDCNPVSSRSSGRRFICRNRSYDLRCTSMRFGNAMYLRILEKSWRTGSCFGREDPFIRCSCIEVLLQARPLAGDAND